MVQNFTNEQLSFEDIPSLLFFHMCVYASRTLFPLQTDCHTHHLFMWYCGMSSSPLVTKTLPTESSLQL